jgi:hypothetical protein
MYRNEAGREVFHTRPVIHGLTAGVAFIYATAALVKI